MRRGISRIPRVQRRSAKGAIKRRRARHVPSDPAQVEALQETHDNPMNTNADKSITSSQDSKATATLPSPPTPSLPIFEVNTEEQQQQGFHAIPAEPEWKSSVDWKSNQKYYFNLLTKEVQWEKPNGFDEKKLAYKEAIKKYKRGNLSGPETVKNQSMEKRKQTKKLRDFWKQEKSQDPAPSNKLADKYSTVEDIQSIADKYVTVGDVKAIATRTQTLGGTKQTRRKRFPFFGRRSIKDRINGNCDPQGILLDDQPFSSNNLSFCGVNSFLPDETHATDPSTSDEAEWDKGVVMHALSSRSIQDNDSVSTADSYYEHPFICGKHMPSSSGRDPPRPKDIGNSTLASTSFDSPFINTLFCGLVSNLPKIAFRSPVVLASFDSRDDETYGTLSQSMSQTTMSQTTMSEANSRDTLDFPSQVEMMLSARPPSRLAYI